MDVPSCYLPATPSSVRTLLTPRLTALSTGLSRDFAVAAKHLDSERCSPAAVAEQSLWLAGCALRAISTADDLPESLESAVQRVKLSDVLTFEQLNLRSTADLTPLLHIFIRYDDYFNTQRCSSHNAPVRLRQLLETVIAVLQDLPRCLLDANEISAILSAISAALGPGAAAAGPELSDPEMPEPFPEESPKVEALYRWKVGHHLFNLLTVQATERLLDCSEAGNADVCAEALRQATVLLRGTTAAMWYAEGFPRNLYAGYIRPTMVDASGVDSGFSGTDNLEFRFFKIAVPRAFNHLKTVFGSPDDWPQDLWRAAYDFCDTRQLDLEHHTLLAEKVVGHEPSLKQIQLMKQTGTPEAANDRPAIEALRELISEARNFKEQLL